MLATDAAGEGINLQFAWIMVNYDIPWNPARLEQRMGRLHRFGQRHEEVRIFNLVAKEDTREGDVLATLLQKIEEARMALSTDKVFDIVGQQLPESSIRDLLLDRIMQPQSDTWRKQMDAMLATQKFRESIEKMRKQASKYGDVGRRLGQLQAEMDVEDFAHLLPAYVQNFVEKSAHPLGLKLDGDLGTAARLQTTSLTASWLSALESGLPDGIPEYLSVRRDPPPCELANRSVHFLRPGDPFFEGLCREIISRADQDTRRGAMFCDPTTEKPYGVAFYVCQIGERQSGTDGESTPSARNLLDRRLIAVKWHEDGAVDLCAPNHILALQPASKADLWRANRLLRDPEEQVERCDQYAKALAETTLLKQIRTAVMADSTARLEDLSRGFDYRAADLGQERSKWAKKAREGNQAAATRLAEIKAEQARLSENRESAMLRERRRVDLLDVVRFERVAVGLVIPDDSESAREAYDRNIEDIAVRVARNYEIDRYQARVLDVSAPHLAKGYDLESHRANGEVVAIEVKGRAGRGAVHLTENEWPTAVNVRERYWLYVVVDCATAPTLYRVQDPAFKLAVKSRKSFTIGFGDIVREAEPD